MISLSIDACMHACLFFSPITKIDHTTKKPSAWYIKCTQNPSKIQKGVESMQSKSHKKWLTIISCTIEIHLFINHWSFKTIMGEYCSCIMAVICVQSMQSLYVFAAICIVCHLLLLIIPTAINSSATTRHGEACALAMWWCYSYI